MEANDTNCSSALSTNDYLITILGSLGTVSVAVCLTALCLLLCLQLYRQLLYRLAAYQVIASLWHALFSVSQFAFLEFNDSKQWSCVSVGYLFLSAGWVKVCFGCWLTFHIFCFAVLLRNMKRLEPLYVVSSILFSFLICLVFLITKSLGPSGEWCSVKVEQCGSPFLTGITELMALWYGPAFVALLLQFVGMLTSVIVLCYRAHRSPENAFGCEQNKRAFLQLLPLVTYPLLTNIFFIPPLIDRMLGYIRQAANNDLATMTAICIPLWSFCSGMALIMHIGVLRCSTKDSNAMNTKITAEPETRRLFDSTETKGSLTYYSIPADPTQK